MLVLINLAATLFMTGLVWFVQVVHYPLYSRVPPAGFVAYQTAHTRVTTWVVGLPMLIELATSILLLVDPPTPVSSMALWLGLALTGLIWASTAAVQIPLHDVLTAGYDGPTQRKLVRSNWVRTIAWSIRSGLMLWIASRLPGPR